MQAQKGKSLTEEKVISIAKSISEYESLWPLVLVFAGAFFAMEAVPFYPLLVSIILALLCAAVAKFKPSAGVILALIFPLFAFAYQAPGFAWLYFLIVFAIALFEIAKNWELFSIMQIAIFAPFFPFPFVGVFTYISLALASLYVGAKRSLYLSILAIFFIMLISSIWLQENSSALAMQSLSNFYPAAEFCNLGGYPEPGYLEFIPAIGDSLSGMFSIQSIFAGFSGFAKILANSIELLVFGPAVIIIGAWAIALFALAYLPAHMNIAKKQSVAALCLLLIPVANYFASIVYSVPFDMACISYVFLAWVAIFALDTFGITLSRENDIESEQKQKKFGKFGIEDMTQSAGPRSFADVGGYADVKAELMDAIAAPLQHKEFSLAYGLKPVSGILLFGPPGTGKTLIVSALAKELKMGFYYVKCSELISAWYGESEKNISELFDIARTKAPCILFFDEMDSLAKSREKYFADDLGPRILSELLKGMDGFKKHSTKPVIIIGATNLPQNLDPAIMRPGRLDKIIYMPLPDLEARLAVLKVHCSKAPLADDVNLDDIAEITEGYSGADIANIVSEAIRLAAREARSKNKIVPVGQKHLLAVLKNIRPSTSQEAIRQYDSFRDRFERSTKGA